ncbi:hypothetical protein [uncultured Aliivibrio sp.]|uniref:hypothetical protein n=1 Tax=uncultured Aliivibrio sp. TaxID=873085 RepID=UPI00262179FE|nr:hypothetical protein [uncultured Aliivibrio sp.]
MILKQIEHYFKKTALISMIRNYVKSKNNKHITVMTKDYSYLSSEILDIISSLNKPIYPMFGTLLSIHRDNAFLYADDYDFALNDKSYFNFELINDIESYGLILSSFSIANNELVELSFKYKGVSVDFFLIKNNIDESIHLCPNFRQSKSEKSFESNLKVRTYPSHFSVTYPKIELEKSFELNLWIPKDPVSIFEKHYGHDWNVPKTENFIDFNNYQFHEISSATYCGESKHLIAYLRKYNLL